MSDLSNTKYSRCDFVEKSERAIEHYPTVLGLLIDLMNAHKAAKETAGLPEGGYALAVCRDASNAIQTYLKDVEGLNNE